MSRFKELSGQRFGRLVAIERLYRDKGRNWCWRCACDCGKETVVAAASLIRGNTKSCGCQQKDSIRRLRFKHGFSHTFLGHVRTGLVQRCYNPNHESYKRYGARGIKVCNEWRENPETFFIWALNNGYREGLSIDRIDNDGDYTPTNCRWVTAKEQANNKSDNFLLTLDGETKTLSQWCEDAIISPSVLRGRVLQGDWTKEELFSTPVGEKRKQSEGLSSSQISKLLLQLVAIFKYNDISDIIDEFKKLELKERDLIIGKLYDIIQQTDWIQLSIGKYFK